MTLPLSYDEKLSRASAHREAGNAAFVGGSAQGALKEYWCALLALQGITANPLTHILGPSAAQFEKTEGAEDVVTEDKRQLSLVQSNMAACYLQLKKPARALELSTSALSSDPNNAKASFRRAKAFRELGRSRDALAAFKELEARLRDPEVTRERERLEAEVKEKEKEGMKGFKGLFAK